MMRISAIVVVGFGVLAAVVVSCSPIHLPFGYTVNFPGGIPFTTRKALSEKDLIARIHVPAGFSFNRYDRGIPNARALLFTDSGDLLVSSPRDRKVVLLEADANHDGYADGQRDLLTDLNQPHGIALRDGWLYVAETDAILRVRYDAATRSVAGAPERIITGLPGGGNHWTRTIAFGPDGWLYVSIGSSCNVCEEEDPRRATISRYHADGTGGEIYATGLRNSVFFDWQPGTNDLYATDNGRDLLGDDFPPCELNRIVQGGFYGWPNANGDRIPDPDFGGDGSRAKASIAPAFAFGGHTAPLGITFYRGTQFPERYRNAAFVAQHGSWNRSRKSGYRVLALFFGSDGKIEAEDFATGFEENEDVFGRPTGLAVGPDGALYVSDDFTGSIYRIAYGAAVAPRTDGVAVGAAHGGDPLAGLDSATRQAAVAHGQALWVKYGCAQCHTQQPQAKAPLLQNLTRKYDIDSLSAFLRAPQPPMPQFPLSDDERRDLAIHLLSEYR